VLGGNDVAAPPRPLQSSQEDRPNASAGAAPPSSVDKGEAQETTPSQPSNKEEPPTSSSTAPPPPPSSSPPTSNKAVVPSRAYEIFAAVERRKVLSVVPERGVVHDDQAVRIEAIEWLLHQQYGDVGVVGAQDRAIAGQFVREQIGLESPPDDDDKSKSSQGERRDVEGKVSKSDMDAMVSRRWAKLSKDKVLWYYDLAKREAAHKRLRQINEAKKARQDEAKRAREEAKKRERAVESSSLKADEPPPPKRLRQSYVAAAGAAPVPPPPPQSIATQANVESSAPSPTPSSSSSCSTSSNAAASRSKKSKKKIPDGREEKQALSAYNIFYAVEREKMLEVIPDGGVKHHDQAVRMEAINFLLDQRYSDREKTDEHDRRAVERLIREQKAYKDPNKPKRSHKKEHGKLSFRDMNKALSGRWNSLPYEKYLWYHEMARKARIDRWKKLGCWTEEEERMIEMHRSRCGDFEGLDRRGREEDLDAVMSSSKDG